MTFPTSGIGRLVTERRASKVFSVLLQPLDENAKFFKSDQSKLVVVYLCPFKVRLEKCEADFFSSKDNANLKYLQYVLYIKRSKFGIKIF